MHRKCEQCGSSDVPSQGATLCDPCLEKKHYPRPGDWPRRDVLIISRHRGAVEFIARELGGTVHTMPGGRLEVRLPVPSNEPEGEAGTWEKIDVLDEATADDVRGAVVYGNLPPRLASLAREVYAVDFEGSPPRGQNYTLAEMDAAGSRLFRHMVLSEAQYATFSQAIAESGGGPLHPPSLKTC